MTGVGDAGDAVERRGTRMRMGDVAAALGKGLVADAAAKVLGVKPEGEAEKNRCAVRPRPERTSAPSGARSW